MKDIVHVSRAIKPRFLAFRHKTTQYRLGSHRYSLWLPGAVLLSFLSFLLAVVNLECALKTILLQDGPDIKPEGCVIISNHIKGSKNNNNNKKERNSVCYN